MQAGMLRPLFSLVLLAGVALAFDCDNTTHFDCHNGKCVPLEWLCDNIRDCGNGMDEANCHYLHECPADKMICKNGECVSKAFKCDGAADCLDGSDETGCPVPSAPFAGPSRPSRVLASLLSTRSECAADRFQCHFGPCLHATVKCDGIDDCPLGDDEENCATPAPLTSNDYCERIRPGWMACAGSLEDEIQCIPGQWRCDGEKDCDDGSDEENCRAPEDDDSETLVELDWLCPPEHYQCNDRVNRTCVPMSKTCNGVSDCPGGDDEPAVCRGACDGHDCDFKCRPTALGPECYCATGSALLSDSRSCREENACEIEGKGKKCQHACDNLGMGTYRCQCAQDYVLQPDGFSCRLPSGFEGGNLYISLGSEVRRTDLFNAETSTQGYQSIVSLGNEGTIRSIAVDHWNSTLYMAITTASAHGHISVWQEGRIRTLLDNIPGVGHVAFDHIGRNIYYTARYPSERPGIYMCSEMGVFCARLVGGRAASDVNGKMDRQFYRGFAINPLRGVMCWIDSYGTETRIQCANMDGTNVTTVTNTKLEYPAGMAFDTITNQLYYGDVDREMIEKIVLDGDERHVVLSSGVHHPYDLAAFNGHIFWTDWETESLRSVELGVEHTNHLLHSFQQFPYGIAIDHPAYQPMLSSPNPCDASPCGAYLCVVRVVEGMARAYCVCPDGYDSITRRDKTVACTANPTHHVDTEKDTHLAIGSMLHYCDQKIACLNGGECENVKNAQGRTLRTVCKCPRGFRGAMCEDEIALDELLTMSLEDDEETHWFSILFFLLFCLLSAAGFYYAWMHREQINDFTKDQISRGQGAFERLPSPSALANRFAGRVPQTPQGPSTSVAQSAFANPTFESAPLTGPSDAYVSTMGGAPFNGIEVSYKNKFDA